MGIRYALAKKRAEDLLRKVGITEPPIPVEKLAEHVGARIHLRPFEGTLSGMVHRRDGPAVIGVNLLHAPTRRRFTIAHELGHLVMLEGDEELHVDEHFPMAFRNDVSGKAVDPREIEANQFAAALLMPEAMVRKDIRQKAKRGLPVDEEEIEALAKRYDVSVQAMTFRLANLRLIK